MELLLAVTVVRCGCGHWRCRPRRCVCPPVVVAQMVAKLRSSGVLATIRKLKGLPPATTAPVPTVGAGGGKKGGKSSARCPPADCVPQTAPPGVDDTDFQRLTMFELTRRP